MKLNKKGIGIGQVFVFIVAALTFGLIMIFGYKAISGFLESGEDVEFVQFKTDLESSIKRIYTKYNAIRKETYSPPLRYEQICFINLDYPDERIASEVDVLCGLDVAACSVWEDVLNRDPSQTGYSSSAENVFLTPPAPVKIKVHKISTIDESNGLERGFLCIPIKQGQFKLTLEGKGDRTEISSKEGIPIPADVVFTDLIQ